MGPELRARLCSGLMILITGPGRAGTSLIASIYKSLGFDPGGRYREDVRAGFESSATQRANSEIADDLRMTLHQTSRARRGFIKYRSRFLGPQLLDWDRFDGVVARYSERLREIAANQIVVKDPRFSWTLPVWLESGADIEHVLIATRSFKSMAKSRLEAGLSDFSESDMRNAIIYGNGILLSTITEYNVPYSLLHFPDWLDNPMELYEAAKWPGEISEEDFMEAFRAHVRRDYVQH